jgi:hypothetical protein
MNICLFLRQIVGTLRLPGSGVSRLGTAIGAKGGMRGRGGGMAAVERDGDD